MGRHYLPSIFSQTMAMFKQKRRAARKTAHLPVTLALYDTYDDRITAGPAPSFLLDISYYGAGIILPKIFFAPHHLFYAPLDDDAITLCLGTKNADKPPLIIPVKPIWFRLGEKETKGYFKLGVEFQTDPEDSDLITLEEIALANLHTKENLLAKLRRVFH